MSKKDQPQRAERDTKLWTKDFLIITLVNFLLFCGFQLFPSSLPLYLKDLGVSDSLLGWVAAATTVGALLVRPFSGSILDQWGRKGVFIVGLLIMIAVSLAYAFFPFVGIIFVIRFMHGIGWGISSTATSTIASDIIPRKRFGEGLGYFSLSGSLALAVAPGLAIALFYSVGMHVIAYLGAGILVCALLLALIIKYQPTTKSISDKRPKLIEKASLLPAVIVFFVSATYGALVTFLAIHAGVQGVENIGMFFTVYAVALLISRPMSGRLVDKKGAAFVIMPALVLLVVAITVLAFANSLVWFLVCAVLYGFSFGAAQASLQTLAILSAPPERRGAANATFFTGFDAGIGFGSVLSGIVASLVGYMNMYLVFTLFPFIAAGIFIVALRRSKRRTP